MTYQKILMTGRNSINIFKKSNQDWPGLSKNLVSYSKINFKDVSICTAKNNRESGESM